MRIKPELAVRIPLIFLILSIFLSYPSYARQDTSSAVLVVSYIDGALRLQKPFSEGRVKLDSGAVVTFDEEISSDENSKAELVKGQTQIIRLGEKTIAAVLRRKIADTDRSLAGFVTVAGDFWSEGVSDSNYLPITSQFRNGGSAWLTPTSDSTPAIFRVMVGIDSTTEIKAYSGQLKIIYFASETPADSTNSLGEARLNDEVLADRGRVAMPKNTIILSAGEKIGFSSSGKIVYKNSFSPDDIDEKTDWVNWNLARDQIK